MPINMKLLRSLIEAKGISGREFEVKRLIERELKKHCKDVRTDKFGNLLSRKKGKGKKIMLSAHMDEIGLIIKTIDARGRIRFSPIGGMEPLSLLGQRVSMRGLAGVITTKEMNDSEEIEDMPKIRDMFIDTGLDKRRLARAGIGTGTIISLMQESGALGKGFIYGKALDDRIGCYILLELAKRFKRIKNELFFVFTVQEEVGLYGGKTSAYNIEPDWAIAVDVTNADDAEDPVSKTLGGGPTVTIKDEELVTNYCLDECIKKLARKNRIPIQLDVSEGGTTEATSVSIARGGIPSTVMGVPIRNLHTTVGIASLKDIENAIRLLEVVLKNSDKMMCRG